MSPPESSNPTTTGPEKYSTAKAEDENSKNSYYEDDQKP